METVGSGRKLHMGYKLVLFLQAAAMLVLLVLFLRPGGELPLGAQDFTVQAGHFETDREFVITGADQPEKGVCLVSRPLTLEQGIYRLDLSFDGDSQQACLVRDESAGYHELLTNTISLHESRRTSSSGVTFMLNHDTDRLYIDIIYTGIGEFRLHQVTLQDTRQKHGVRLIWVFFLSLVLDLLLFSRNRRRMFWLLAMGALVSYPLLIDYVHLDDDCLFHFTRMEGIMQAWKAGQFPARLQPNWLNGMGYPVSIMYGDLFYWPTALFHLLGLDLMASYKLGAALCNFCTVFLCFHSFRQMFEREKVCLFGTFLYCFSLYRLNNLYLRGAVGEYTAMAFLPVIAAGLWLLFTGREKKSVWYMAAGFTGLLQSHVLSFEFACFFTGLICIINWKKLLGLNTAEAVEKLPFVRRPIAYLLKAAALTILLNLWFLVPFLDYVMHLPMKVLGGSLLIQERGLYPAQLLSVFQWAGNSAFMTEHGMHDMRPFGMGMALLAVLFLFLLLKRKESWGKLAKQSAYVGIFAAWACTNLFPWDGLSKHIGVVRKVASSIQYPYRILVIVTICLCVAACAMLMQLERRGRYLMAGVLLVMTLVSALFVMDDDLQRKYYSGLRSAEALGSEYVSGMEYLLEGMTLDELNYNELVASEGVAVNLMEKDFSHLRFACDAAAVTSIDVDNIPCVDTTLLYYIGYRAVDEISGEQLPIGIGKNNVLRVFLPAGYQGIVRVDFAGKWYWHVADVISLLTLLGVCAVLVRRMYVHRVHVHRLDVQRLDIHSVDIHSMDGYRKEEMDE